MVEKIEVTLLWFIGFLRRATSKANKYRHTRRCGTALISSLMQPKFNIVILVPVLQIHVLSNYCNYHCRVILCSMLNGHLGYTPLPNIAQRISIDFTMLLSSW